MHHLCECLLFKQNWYNCNKFLQQKFNNSNQKSDTAACLHMYNTCIGRLTRICMKRLPGPALAMWQVASNSRVTGFPGRTPDSCDTVLLTVEQSLFKTSIVINLSYLHGGEKRKKYMFKYNILNSHSILHFTEPIMSNQKL